MSNKPLIATGLDAGSTSTRCVVAVLEDERIRLIGYGSVPSKGWAKSRIVDQQAVSDCIHDAVHEAENMAQVQVQTVVAGVGGLSARGANSRGLLDLGRPREILQRDINRSMDRARAVQLHEDRMVLQALWQDFVVDDHPGFHDPRNMLASKLEANAHLIMVSAQEHNNLVGAINRAHLAADETIYEGVASCYASVLPDDRREGVALVDIGTHSTELVCYFGDSMQLATSLRICGDHFSRDIAHALRIPYEAAVVVKEEFGCATAEGTAANSVVELPLPERVGLEGLGSLSNKDNREAPRQMINQILESRAVELFSMVREELQRAGMARSIASGLVISGGGALLPGMCDVAERVLDSHSRIGLAQGFLDWPDQLKDPAWTTVAGLAMYSARLRTQVDQERQAVGALGRFLR